MRTTNNKGQAVNITRKYDSQLLQSIATNKLQCVFLKELGVEMTQLGQVPQNIVTGDQENVLTGLKISGEFKTGAAVGATQLPIEAGYILLTTTWVANLYQNYSSVDQDWDKVIMGANFINWTLGAHMPPAVIRVKARPFKIVFGIAAGDVGHTMLTWNVPGPFISQRQVEDGIRGTRMFQYLGIYCIFPTGTNNASPVWNGMTTFTSVTRQIKQSSLIKRGLK